jgi:hypothetical protein
MRNHYVRILGLSAAALMLASSAQAQGKSQGKGHGKGKGNEAAEEHGAKGDPRKGEGVIVREGDRVYGSGKKVPPGLAKKPGQMPPGQYKKRYGTNEGADVLGGIFRRHGYTVVRMVPAGESQYVYYRLRDGSERRAIVSPGTDRLVFRNVPSSLLAEVLSKLY